MQIKVCIGSSCHLKGSRQVVEELNDLLVANHLDDRVDLLGSFCMGNCQNGVCVTLDDEMYSLSPETTKQFFEEHVKSQFNKAG